MPRSFLMLTVLLFAGCNLFAKTPDGADASVDVADTNSIGDTAPPTDMGAGDQSQPSDMRTPDLPASNMGIDTEVADLGPTDMPPMDAGADIGEDAAMTDMTPDIPPDMPSTDPCLWPDTLFCSGFDDSTFADWEGTFDNMCGVTHETTIVHSGTGALKTDVLQGEGTCGTYFDSITPIENGDSIWVRAWIYVPSSLNLDYFEWVGLANFDTDEEINAGIWSDGIDGHLHLDSYDGYPSSTYSVPRDEWHCFEWNIQFDSQAGRSFVAVDGVTRVDVGALPLTLIEPLDTFGIGQVWTGENQQGEVYFDDVFLGHSRPGCD